MAPNKGKPTAAASLAKITGGSAGSEPATTGEPPSAPELVGGDHSMTGAELDVTPRPEQAAPSPTDKLRMTVVLDPVEVSRLDTFREEAQRATGRRGIAGSEVVRRAVERVLRDPKLRSELVEDIRREGGNRRAEGGKRTRS